MRKLALITAAVMMSVGSIGTAAATVAPSAIAPVSTQGVLANRLAIGLAQPAQDNAGDEAAGVTAGGGIGTEGVIVAVVVVVAIGAGVAGVVAAYIFYDTAAGVSNNDTRPTSSYAPVLKPDGRVHLWWARPFSCPCPLACRRCRQHGRRLSRLRLASRHAV